MANHGFIGIEGRTVRACVQLSVCIWEVMALPLNHEKQTLIAQWPGVGDVQLGTSSYK